MSDDDSLDWRNYAAWGSFLCGGYGLLLTSAVLIYIHVSQKHPYDVWEARYFSYTLPVVLFGVLLGIVGRDNPRIPGLVLSACIVVLILRDAISL